MTDLLDAFKHKADDLLATINQKGGVRATIEGLRHQMAEADRRRAIGRVKDQLQRLDLQINEMVTAVGLQAVALQEAGQLTSPELQALCQHIIDLKAALSQQQVELAALESSPASAGVTGTSPCVRCGKPVPVGGTFCPYCGTPVPTTVSTPTAASAPSAGIAPPPSAVTPSAAPSASPATFSPQPPIRPEPAASPQAVPPTTTCAHCGATLKPGAKFCSKCGRPV